jgi:hypothetical protein
MVWFRANIEPFRKEINVMVGKDKEKRVQCIFNDIKDYVSRYYVSKQVMATCIKARERIQKENHELKKQIAGYKILIKGIGLKKLDIQPDVEVNTYEQTA